uniref:Uncharacterized protein n=1 Tax=Oryza nivara TaxID=4536 RepID=A0A0E0G4U5_ORYNI
MMWLPDMWGTRGSQAGSATTTCGQPMRLIKACRTLNTWARGPRVALGLDSESVGRVRGTGTENEAIEWH